MSDLQLRFRKQLGDTHIDVDLAIPSSGVTAIFGRSGAGKTSLINVISGLICPDDGEITFNGRTLFSKAQGINVPIHRRNIGYVFQEARLFPHYSVKGNLLYGVKEIDAAQFDTITSLLAIQHLLKRFPHQLSGGEKQRVAIGRALLSKPDILLMDEPLASLDLPRKREVLPFLEQLTERVKLPIVYVSHSLDEVLRLARHLVVIDKGQVTISGRLENVWASAAMRPWQSYAEQSSLFEGRISEHWQKYALSKVSIAPNVALWVQKVDMPVNSSVRMQIRANDVSLTTVKPQSTSIRNILPATVKSVEVLHDSIDKQSVAVEVELARECFLWARLTAWAVDELNLKPGDDVYVQVKGASISQKDVSLSH
ncbi:molybdate transport system ATP-binding protein [Vibrio xiamenensis]|uniref:Molybdate transport system ATP-binding protein n=1 Tax=Vibrio xiamenensis TaxID=861298 RepID=A0A1G7YST4_9VIBR|nr:molybdenum ABC transporter ATP-binding protein ModC [Vibrio xiamenensis]SDG99578.1 molybdate transport system ATP-binding protein [Vibrio xiamenensis]